MAKKVFISHSSKDDDYANVFVELLELFGFREKDIFCSSNYSTGIAYGEHIFERLKKELSDGPVVIYLLSNDYYESVICLNEMGASWMMSDEHYPVALPEFEVNKIKGAVSSSRLALNVDQFDPKVLFRFVEKICLAANVEWPEYVRLSPLEYIVPLAKKFNDIILKKEVLSPVDGLFEAVLGDEPPLIGEYKDRACCYKLCKRILPENLNMEDKELEDSQFLFIWKDQGEFKSGDKVRFRVKDSNQKYFSDIGLCRNIYVNFIQKVEDQYFKNNVSEK